MIFLFSSHCRSWLEKVGRKLLWWRSPSITTTGSKSDISESDPDNNQPFMTIPPCDNALSHSTTSSCSLPDLTRHSTKEFLHPIAHGSFGDVWKCTYTPPKGRDYHTLIDSNSELEVAVKSIRIDVAGDDSRARLTQRLLDDFHARKKLHHENLLTILGLSYKFSLLPAIVSPWMHKGSLTTYLEQSAELAIKSRLRILQQVAAAISYLHSNGVVHGDLTANNILIDLDGNAHVADHGILTMCSELSGTSYIRSNVRWAAPELFEVPENFPSTASDVYSIGCIILQVMTRRVPYADVPSARTVVGLILAGEKPPRPSRPPIPDSIWNLIQKCWGGADYRPSAADVVGLLESAASA